MTLKMEQHTRMLYIWIGLMVLGLVGFMIQPNNAGMLPKGTAVAVLNPTAGHQVKGEVKFEQEGQGVKIVAALSGLQPGGHGFHIHETGDCSAPDGTSAGGHYNPFDAPHGGPEAALRHVGDLGNLEANADGTAQYQRYEKGMTLDGPHGIVGRAVIVHAGEDDFSTQPTGRSGSRVACGVIGVEG